jgi:hypothetical protein
MDAERFERVVRTLTTSSSRRQALGVLAAALFGGQLGAAAPVSVAKGKKGKGKKGKGKRRRCTPQCAGRGCGDNGCGGSCGTCGPCADCSNGVCVARANGISCGGSCKECQAGQCVNKVDGTECPEGELGRCRAGICNPIPPCATFGNTCTSGRECCYQEPGDPCPAPPTCSVKVAAGQRCRFNADCISDSCVGYICN